MNKIFSTLLFFFAFVFHLFAQQAMLTGTVTDGPSGAPLIAATVQSGSTGTVTEVNGTFSLPLEAGTHEVTFSYVGYEKKTETVTLAAGETRSLALALEESPNILQTATVTSGRTETALGEVTVSIEVIKPALIQSSNQTSLSGLLEKVPGLTMVGDQANIRGGSGFSYGAGSRVLLLVDDIPIYQADAGFPQWEDVPLENIEQVEVVKGASSALYGSSALNGIVNVRTAYAKSKPETFFAPYYTIYSSPKREELKWWEGDEAPYTTGFSVAHRRKIGKFDLVLGGNYYRNNSFRDSVLNRRGRWNVNTRYRFSDRLTAGINSNFNRGKGTSFFFWQDINNLYRPGTNVSRSNNFRFNIDPYVTYFDPAGNRHKLQGRFFSVQNKTGSVGNDQSNISDVYYGEYQFQRKMEKIGLVVSAGGVYIETKVRAPLYGDTTFTSRNLAGYLQLDKKFFDRLTISGGFRFEKNVVLTPDSLVYESGFTGRVPGGRIEESKPVFRLGGSFQAGKATFFRASWGQGYRFPTIAEKFIYTTFGSVPITPNLDLHSETGWTAEVGIRQGFKLDNFLAYADLAFFQSQYNDMMEFTFVTQGLSFQSQNIGDTKIKGFEVSLSGKGNFYGWETTMLAGYTYIDPRFKEFDITAPSGSPGRINAQNSSICSQPNDPDKDQCHNILKYRYKHNGKLDLEMRRLKFSAGVAAQYSSFMENIDAVFETPLLKPPSGIGLQEWRAAHNDGDLVWNLRTAWRFTDYFKLSFLVNNMFNREYSTRPAELEGPRSWTVRGDLEF